MTEKSQKSRAEIWREKGVVVCGISGKIGSGKTTLADALQISFPSSSTKVIVRNFADSLKEEVALHLNVGVALCYSHEGKNTYLPDYGMTVGEFLQQWGTRLRDLHPQIWVLAVQSFIDRCVRDTAGYARTVVLIGDCRFPNEVEWVHSVGGKVVRLNGDPANERARSTRDLNHISETALDSFDGFDLVVNTDACDKAETKNRVLKCLFSQQR